jgi:hypothetical protein
VLFWLPLLSQYAPSDHPQKGTHHGRTVLLLNFFHRKDGAPSPSLVAIWQALHPGSF